MFASYVRMKREGLKKDNLARQEVESMWNISGAG